MYQFSAMSCHLVGGGSNFRSVYGFPTTGKSTLGLALEKRGAIVLDTDTFVPPGERRHSDFGSLGTRVGAEVKLALSRSGGAPVTLLTNVHNAEFRDRLSASLGSGLFPGWYDIGFLRTDPVYTRSLWAGRATRKGNSDVPPLDEFVRWTEAFYAPAFEEVALRMYALEYNEFMGPLLLDGSGEADVRELAFGPTFTHGAFEQNQAARTVGAWMFEELAEYEFSCCERDRLDALLDLLGIVSLALVSRDPDVLAGAHRAYKTEMVARGRSVQLPHQRALDAMVASVLSAGGDSRKNAAQFFEDRRTGARTRDKTSALAQLLTVSARSARNVLLKHSHKKVSK